MDSEAGAWVREGQHSQDAAQDCKAHGEREAQGNWAFWVQTRDPHPGEGQFFCSPGGEGAPRQSKDQGAERELRLWGEADLGSSLTLPFTQYVTLGNLFSLSEPQFPYA